MSVRDLFNQQKVLTQNSGSSGKDFVFAESYKNVDKKNELFQELVPHVDYTLPDNFAKFGSAELYYKTAFEYVNSEYPYDGSDFEKNEFKKNLNHPERFVFDNIYPKFNGYAVFSAGGWGTLAGSLVDGYGNPTSKEYIDLKGGPNVSSTVSSTNRQLFELKNRATRYETKSQIAKREGVGTDIVPGDRKSSLQTNFTNGSTIEFWFKKPAFDNTKTKKEVIFDLSNSQVSSSAAYGRFTLSVTGTSGNSPFLLTVQSGTTGFYERPLGSTLTTSSFSSFPFYTFRTYNNGTNFTIDLYRDGKILETSTVSSLNIGEIGTANKARIGSLISSPSGSTAPAGAGKLSASMDDFRFWTTKRSSAKVLNYSSQPVPGGANTDFANTDLGFYYKFNEGITTNDTIDSVVLDYSGRITNGSWTGYSSNSRTTDSAFVLSSKVQKESKDPVVNSSHPSYTSLKSSYQKSGSYYDSQNASYMRNYFPQWMLDEQDDNPHLNYLLHIAGQYFDNLFLKIQDLPKLQKKEYDEDLEKPYKTNKMLLESKGLATPELFLDSTILNYFSERDPDILFDENLVDIKNKIYRNLYNNLDVIYKSKGTLKSFRYLFNALGLPDNLINPVLYSRFSDIDGANRSISSVDNIKFIDFPKKLTKGATIYQALDASNSNSLGFLSSSADNNKEPNYGFTLEGSFNFPDPRLEFNSLTESDLTKKKSIFGAYQKDTPTTDQVNFQVFIEKEDFNSKNAKFILTSSVSPNNLPTLTTQMFSDVYSDNDWHVSVSLYPSNYPLNNSVISGSDNYTYTVVFQGQNVSADQKIQSFFLTSSVSKTVGQNILKNQKQVYVGANRQNLSGSVLFETQMKANMVNFWNIGLSNTDIDNHAKDVNNRSITNATKLRLDFDSEGLNGKIDKSSTLAISWDFDSVTASDASGNFIVADASSGSVGNRQINDWFGTNYGYQHTGYGFGFPASATSFVINEKVLNSTFKQADYSNNIADDIRFVTEDDKFFDKNSTPSDYLLTFEKSPYETVSRDMLDYFGVFADLNEMVGAPVQRYRHSYKDLSNLATKYFRSVNTEVDVQKYFDYFKWFDDAIEIIIKQMVPLSIISSARINNVIENHALKRSKFRHKYQNIKEVNISFEGSVFGPHERDYNWKVGHAPISNNQMDNGLWWYLRAEREHLSSTSGVSSIDIDRNTINRVKVTQVSGSTFATRRLTRPVKLRMKQVHSYKGGTNFNEPKRIDFTYSSLRPAGPVNKEGGIFVPQNVLVAFGEDMVTHKDSLEPLPPNTKVKRYAKVFQGRDYKTGHDYESTKNSFSFPFNLISSSVSSGYQAEVQDRLLNSNIEIVNIHNDVYGPDMEKPLQGPFTEYAVGGHQSRHIALNKGSDTWKTRPEAWKILLGRCVSPMTSIGMVGPDYPYPEANAVGASPYPLTAAHKAAFYRDGTAKRPVNISNIQHRTGSTILGNYSDNWEVVHTFGRTSNNRLFAKSPTQLPNRLSTTLPKTTQVKSLLDREHKRANHFDYNNDLQVFSSTTPNRSVIVNRFSAPGGSLTMTDAFLNYDSREFSSYNETNFRNIVVRGFGHEVSASGGLIQGAIDIHGNNLSMKAHLVRHTGRFGRDSKIVLNPTGLRTESPGYHKVHRNSITRVNQTTNVASVLVPGSAQLTNTKALKFDHSKDSVLFVGPISSVGNDVGATARSSSIDEFYTNGFTLSMWVRTPSILDDGSQRNYYSHGCQVNDPIVRIFKPSNPGDRGKVGVEINTTSNFTSTSLVDFVTNSQPLSGDSGFHHLVVTISGSNGSLNTTLAVNIYVDGAKITHTKTGTTQPHYRKHGDLKYAGAPYFRLFDGASSAPAIDQLRSMIIIGGKSNESATECFSGSMDEISIWSTPLTQVDIDTVYNGGVPCDITNSTLYTAKSGSLKAWYRMGDTAQDAVDSSNKGFFLGGTNSIINFTGSGGTNFNITPISTSGSANTMVLSTDNVLAGCPGTFVNVETITDSCEDKFDNYYVMHSIPRTENQYSWITASYIGNCSGTLNVGHQPYNTWEYGTDKNGVNPYDLVKIGSDNITTFFSSQNNEYSIENNQVSIAGASDLVTTRTLASSAKHLNALLNNYNGPYQAPTFVFRNSLGVNPIINNLRKNNLLSYEVSDGSPAFVTESVISSHIPIVFHKQGAQAGNIGSAKVSYCSETDTFDSLTLRNKYRRLNGEIIEDSPPVGAYRGLGFILANNFFNEDSVMIFSEQIFPSRENKFTENVIQRDSYFNFFWRNSREDRSRVTSHGDGFAHTNSRGFGRGRSDLGFGESIWPLDAAVNFETRTTVTGSISFGKYGSNPIRGAGELQNNYSQHHMGQAGFGLSTPAQKISEHTGLYSRKHDVASKDSIVSLTGMPLTASGTKTSPGLTDSSYNEYGKLEMFAGDAEWQAPEQATLVRENTSRRTLVPRTSSPWYGSYSDYNDHFLKAKGREYSIVPEYRISSIVEGNGDLGESQAYFLEIVNQTSSIKLPNNSFENEFYRKFVNSSALLKIKEVLANTENSSFEPESIILECSGVMKFLPYDGFYPADRANKMVSLFNDSYGSRIRSNQLANSTIFGTSSLGKVPRPIYQTLFAPGILFNTIKSGMAVDYPVVLGPNTYSTQRLISGSGNDTDYHLGKIEGTSFFGGGSFSSRIPFEAILSPERYIKDISISDNEIHPSSSVVLTSSIDSATNPKYSLAAENFFGAVEEFFLEPFESQEIRSKRFNLTDTQLITLESGKTYMARVVLKRSMTGTKDYSNDAFYEKNNFVVNGAINPHNSGVYSIPQDPKFSSDYRETFTMYSRPTAFGPPMSGRVQDMNNKSYLTKSVSDSINGFNWAYTPPYYNGEAWVDIILQTPTSTTGFYSLTIEQMQQAAKFVYSRVDPGTSVSVGANPEHGELLHAGATRNGRSEPYSAKRINGNAMQLSASFVLDGLRKSIGDNITSQQWIIRPKFLTPMLNFNHLSSSNSIKTSSYGTETIPRGMWHQFGLIPKPDEGITISIDDIPDVWLNNHYKFKNQNSEYNNNNSSSANITNVRSLVDALQFDTKAKQLGKIKNSKKVFEGIVAIPFISNNTSPLFFNYRQNKIKESLKKFDNDREYNDNILKTISFLRRFVMPKEFDPLNAPLRAPTSELEPGGLPILGGSTKTRLNKFFFFELSATLSKNDLSYIWQNLLPRDFEEGLDGRIVYTPDSVSKLSQMINSSKIHLSDKLEISDRALMNAIKSGTVRWHVFKVKQRGVFSYSRDKERSMELDRVRDELVDFKSVSNSFQRFKIKSDNLTFSPNELIGFNWPYDYFSLAEKIKINAKVKFKS